MIMIGQQHSRKLQSGKQLLKMIIVILIVCITLSGCEEAIGSLIPGAGRADWEIQLPNEYYIIRANSHRKVLCKASDIPGVFEDVLTFFYVTKYHVSEPYVFFEGIPTKEALASDEERKSDNRQYFLLDVMDGNLCGPYDTEDALLASDLLKETDLSIVWEILPSQFIGRTINRITLETVNTPSRRGTAPPLLAAASALAGTTVTAAAATTVAAGVATVGIATMGAVATEGILESSSKQGKDYVKARSNKQANQRAQEVGYDGAEELKADYVGKQGSKFNMFTNRATGEIILIGLKVAKEIATHLFRW